MAQMQAMQQQMQQIAASQNNRTGSNYNRNNNSNHPRKNQSSKPFEAALSDAPVPAPPAPKEAYPLQPTDTGLCKFSLGCTHPLCVYSHPSPAATPQSALVLSTEACEAGKDCKDPECVKSHVSPAQLGTFLILFLIFPNGSFRFSLNLIFDFDLKKQKATTQRVQGKCSVNSKTVRTQPVRSSTRTRRGTQRRRPRC